MSELGFKSISGLTNDVANTGIPIASIPGDVGGPISGIVLTAIGVGLPPSDPFITLTLYPNGSQFTVGTDSSGNISADITLLNLGDDKTFAIVGGGGNITLEDGPWAQHIRGSCNNVTGTRGFDIQFTYFTPPEFDGPSLTDTPTDLDYANVAWDTDLEEGSVDLSWSYDNSDAEDPVSFGILRDDGVEQKFVGSVPWEDGITDYSFTDYVFAEGDYTYTIVAYIYSPQKSMSPESNAVVVSFSGSAPDINITGSGGIEFGGSASIVFIGDASGIYTLVPGKTDDTLYNGSGTPVDVAIPDPFFKTAFLGD